MSDERSAADDDRAPDERPLGQRALDALVYAPAGLLLTAVEDLPELAAKGRARLEVEVRNAHLVGRFAVDHLGRRLSHLAEPPAPPAPRPPAPPVAEPAPVDPVPGPVVPGPVVGLAIPDYDTLSASQVVRRLDGLGPDELAAVYRHEAATRSRRTILHRARQLLGSEDPPGR